MSASLPAAAPAIRPLVPADALACVALDRAAFPNLPADPERFAAEHAADSADPAYIAVVAEVAGAVVGYGQAWPEPSLGQCAFELYGIVDPRFRRRGTGGALYDVVRRHAEANGAASLHVQARSDQAGALALLRRETFQEVWTGVRMALDLGSWDPAPWLGRLTRDDGIALRSLAELLGPAGAPDGPQRLYALVRAVEAQVPSYCADACVPSDFERWAADTLVDEASGGLVRNGTFIAETLAGDLVALAFIRRGEEPGVLDGMLTGVDAAWQRRGLGTAVKVASTAWAKAAGWARLEVGTAEVNAGMRAINDALGFTPQPGWSRWESTVGGTEAGRDPVH